MHLVLYEPDIPQNAGTLLRTAACLGFTVHIIEPCGFFLDDPRFKRSVMDYLERVDLRRYNSFDDFLKAKEGRLVLLTTKASEPYADVKYINTDYLMLGRESAGVPQNVHEASDVRVTIPMREGARSLNVAISGAIVMGEALRQLNL